MNTKKHKITVTIGFDVIMMNPKYYIELGICGVVSNYHIFGPQSIWQTSVTQITSTDNACPDLMEQSQKYIRERKKKLGSSIAAIALCAIHAR